MTQNETIADELHVLKIKGSVHKKLKTADSTAAIETELSAEEADYAGAFEEDAISTTDAKASTLGMGE